MTLFHVMASIDGNEGAVGGSEEAVMAEASPSFSRTIDLVVFKRGWGNL